MNSSTSQGVIRHVKERAEPDPFNKYAKVIITNSDVMISAAAKASPRFCPLPEKTRLQREAITQRPTNMLVEFLTSRRSEDTRAAPPKRNRVALGGARKHRTGDPAYRPFAVVEPLGHAALVSKIERVVVELAR